MENENQNVEMNQEPETVKPQQYSAYTPKPPVKHMSLGVASTVLGGISLMCCWFYGLGLIPALIGAILGLIALIKGEGKARVLGGVGLGLSALGLVLGIIMVVTYASMINWNNMTLENLMTLQDVDPNDEEELIMWMQQFFNVDISSYAR